VVNITRRKILAGCGVASLATLAPSFVFAKKTPIAGFEPEPWFVDASLDLRADLAAAKSAGKYLVLLWEQNGCH